MVPLKTILLTGATGFLGSNLAKAFLDEGYTVILLKRSFSSSKRITAILPKVKTYNLDEIDIATVFDENKIDCIVHTAASYGRNGESLSEIYTSNLFFPVNLLDNAIKYKVPYFINTDTALPATLNTYSLSKKQFSDLLQLQKKEVNVVNLELEYFYGPGDDTSKFVTFIIDKMLGNAVEIQLSEGTQLRDFIYIKDVVSAYLLLLKSLDKLLGFNNIPLGSGRSISLKEVILKIKEITNNQDILLNFGAIPMRAGEVMHSKANTTVLESLGWKSEYSLCAGLQETITFEKLAYDSN